MTNPISILPIPSSVETNGKGIAVIGENSAESEVATDFVMMLEQFLQQGTGLQEISKHDYLPSLQRMLDELAEGKVLPAEGNEVAIQNLFAMLGDDSAISGKTVHDGVSNSPILIKLSDELAAKNSKSWMLVQQNLVTTEKPAKNPPINAGMIFGRDGVPDVVDNNFVTKEGVFVEGLNKIASHEVSAKKELPASLVNTSLNASAVSENSTANLIPVKTSSSQSSVPLPNNPAWMQSINERVQWMVSQKIQQAEIRLDPPELGTIDIKVIVSKEHSHVNFMASHSQVRDALEQALPRLKEMFESQGLNLANVNVGGHAMANQQHSNDSRSGDVLSGSKENMESVEINDGDVIEKVSRVHIGLLDMYI